MMRELRLYGPLAKQYGRSHTFDVDTPSEALRAMEANHSGFIATLRDLGEKGYGYTLSCGKKRDEIQIAESELGMPVSGSIFLTPVLQGAKKGGIGQIILGAALVVASFYMPGAAAAANAAAGTAATAATGISAMAYSMGMAMALGGVVQLLTPTTNISSGQEKSESTSFIFNGAVNVQAQGHPVPFGYGRMITGSAVISAGLSVNELLTKSEETTQVVIDTEFGGNLFLDFTGETESGVRVVGWFAGNGAKLARTRTEEPANVFRQSLISFGNFSLTDSAGAKRTVYLGRRRFGPSSNAAVMCLSTTDAGIRADGADPANWRGTAFDSMADGRSSSYFENALNLRAVRDTTDPTINDARITQGKTQGVWSAQNGKGVVFSPQHSAWMTPAVMDYLATSEGSMISIAVERYTSEDSGASRYSSDGTILVRVPK